MGDQILLCCERSSPIKNEVALRPMIKLHIHLLIFRNLFVQYQVLLCCERSSSIHKEVVLRPMVDVGQHISKLIIIIKKK